MGGLCTSARDPLPMAALQEGPRRGWSARHCGRTAPRWLPRCIKAENIWMNTGAQDWTMSDAARDRVVLTKNDEEPQNRDEVCPLLGVITVDV